MLFETETWPIRPPWWALAAQATKILRLRVGVCPSDPRWDARGIPRGGGGGMGGANFGPTAGLFNILVSLPGASLTC